MAIADFNHPVVSLLCRERNSLYFITITLLKRTKTKFGSVISSFGGRNQISKYVFDLIFWQMKS